MASRKYIHFTGTLGARPGSAREMSVLGPQLEPGKLVQIIMSRIMFYYVPSMFYYVRNYVREFCAKFEPDRLVQIIMSELCFIMSGIMSELCFIMFFGQTKAGNYVLLCFLVRRRRGIMF